MVSPYSAATAGQPPLEQSPPKQPLPEQPLPDQLVPEQPMSKSPALDRIAVLVQPFSAVATVRTGIH